jgi:LPS-assembly lipoprotein
MFAMFGRRAMFGLAALALGGCGFEPLHARGSADAAAGELAAIRVEPIAERSGQLLRGNLIDRFGTGGERRYVLRVRLVEPRQALALRRDDTITRSSYTVTANFELFAAGGGRIHSGFSTLTTDYEITNSEFATVASRDSARARTLEAVSDDIRQQLAVYFADRRPR